MEVKSFFFEVNGLKKGGGTDQKKSEFREGKKNQKNGERMRKERKEIGKGREGRERERRRRVFRICCGFDHLLGRRCFHGLIELKFCQHDLNSWI